MALVYFLNETSACTGIPFEDLYCTQNGKPVKDECDLIDSVPLRWHVRLIGGKGGFGSMLRAIGAQIEKTTNREACRDLSGRRLRDIREEKRLRDWATKQPEREEEARRKKEEKTKRLANPPKRIFKDDTFEKEHKEIEKLVDESVEKGFQVAGPTTSKPRAIKRQKPTKLWIDEGMSDLSSSESDNENESKSATEQSNDSDKSEEPVLKRSRNESEAQIAVV